MASRTLAGDGEEDAVDPRLQQLLAQLDTILEQSSFGEQQEQRQQQHERKESFENESVDGSATAKTVDSHITNVVTYTLITHFQINYSDLPGLKLVDIVADPQVHTVAVRECAKTYRPDGPVPGFVLALALYLITHFNNLDSMTMWSSFNSLPLLNDNFVILSHKCFPWLQALRKDMLNLPELFQLIQLFQCIKDFLVEFVMTPAPTSYKNIHHFLKNIIAPITTSTSSIAPTSTDMQVLQQLSQDNVYLQAQLSSIQTEISTIRNKCSEILQHYKAQEQQLSSVNMLPSLSNSFPPLTTIEPRSASSSHGAYDSTRLRNPSLTSNLVNSPIDKLTAAAASALSDNPSTNEP